VRKSIGVACLSVLVLLAIPARSGAAPSSSSTSGKGTIEIIFKDGHRQAFNLSEIERIEFPAGDQAGTAAKNYPSRSRFFGKWQVGDGAGHNFYISLYDDGSAKRSLGDERGKWEYVDGEAHITWDDGAQDAIRRAGAGFQKYAYSMGKSFTDKPDNVTSARNTMPSPL
jgi:hypothetical protein